MGSIQTSIQLNDLFSGVMNNIVSSIDIAVASMQNMQQVMNADINTSSFENARNEINQAANAVNELNDAMNTSATPQASTQIMPPVVDSAEQVVNVDVVPVLPDPLVENPEPIRPDIEPNAPPEPVEVPVEWETDGLEVFTGTGIERFQQEVSSADSMLNTLNTTQAHISQTAQNMDILPDTAVSDMNAMQQRLNTIQQKIQQISNNPVNMGSSAANTELERLRAQLNMALQEQSELNTAMHDMDVAAANSAYLRLSQTVSNTERYIRDNVDEQGCFNQEIQEGTSQANGLVNTIKGAVAAYVSIQSVGKALNLSDELVQTTSRLEMMNDGVQTTEELINSVYAAAQDARGSFGDMASVVARFGNNAKDAFGSSEEVVAFANLVQKQMTIAGASTQEAANAELQLSQALGSGVLRGDELNSIFEQAPNLIQNIADYLNVPIGKIREMAADGELSADVVKAAVFAASDDINAKFASMPMTWGQIWTSFQNTAMIAFRPVLQRLNDLANSQMFQNFVNNAIGAVATIAGIVLNLFDLIGSVAEFFADNWSVISPIVYGVIGALAVYAAYLGIIKLIEIASAAATMIHSLAMSAKIAVMAAVTGQTMAATAAQMDYNGALYACPIVWIIVLIIALIAIIFAVCNAIAKMTGVAESGFGVICGGVFVVGATFKNLGMLIANIALGIWSAMKACVENMRAAFHNVISNIKSWFYSLLSTVLTVIGSICEALNKLPFISFDYSGITAAADDYAAKASAAANNKMEYTSVADAYKEGSSKFQAYQDGWAKDAYNAGANFGDNAWSKFKDRFSQDKEDDKPQVDLPQGFSGDSGAADGGEAGGNAAKTAANTGDTADNTAAIAKSLDITNEELKYLRDIAERDTVNRFTTASIKVEMTNHNRIDSKQDLDGIVSTLTSKIENAMSMSAEGVHV